MSAARLQGLTGRYSFLAAQAQYAFNAQWLLNNTAMARIRTRLILLGDRGFSKFEFRVDTTPDYRFLKTCNFTYFYDAGVVWNINTVGQAQG